MMKGKKETNGSSLIPMEVRCPICNSCYNMFR